MKKTAFALFAAVLALLGGIALHQWQTLARDRDELDRERKRTASLQRQLASARQAHETDPAAAAAPPPATSPEDAAIRSHLDPWLVRVRRLRQAFENPVQRIPELALLRDEDWLILARRLENPDSETDLRVAQALVRATAVSRFVNEHLRPALREFARASNDQLPADVSQLALYLKPPADAAMLGRYEMRASGPASQRNSSESIAERAPVDMDYDIRHSLTLTGGGSGPWAMVAMRTAVDDAQRAFTAANEGRRPKGEEDLLPYMRDPIAVTIFQAMASYRKDHHGAESRDTAELRPYVIEPAARARLEQMIRAQTTRGR